MFHVSLPRWLLGLSVVAMLMGVAVLVPSPSALTAAPGVDPPTATATPTPQVRYPTADAAFAAILADYERLIEPDVTFALLEVHATDGWAYVIAVAGGPKATLEHSLVLLGRHEDGSGWYALAPRLTPWDTYNAVLVSFPDTLLDEADKGFFYQYGDPALPPSRLNFSGHKLPWPNGQYAVVTQKDNAATGHTNQVDFDIQGGGSSGDVYASKPGTVVFVKESSNDNSCRSLSCWQTANVVVVRHSSTEYSWYLHLAYNSVPVNVGDSIGFGTKIGVEGSTGYTCNADCSGPGVHLHYMTSTSIPSSWPDPSQTGQAPWPPAGSMTAVDFAEVSWANMLVGHSYTSANSGGSRCPGPSLSSPNDGDTLSSRTITFSWQAPGGCSFSGYTFRVKDTSNMDSGGTTIKDTGEGNTSRMETFDSQWDNRDLWWGVRAANAPVGADWSVRLFRINPGGTNGVELCDGTDYGQPCRLYTEGRYGDLGDFRDRAESLRFQGSYIGRYRAVITDGDNFSGTPFDFRTDQHNLGDYCLGCLRNHVRSINVEYLCFPPGSPPALQSPGNGTTFTPTDSILLVWAGADYGGGFEAELATDGNFSTVVERRTWSGGTSWPIGLRPTATYYWRVRSRETGHNCTTDWSSVWSFTVQAPALPDLQPYTRGGYDYPVVPSSATGTHTLNTLYAEAPSFFDWYFTNRGGPTSASYYVEVWVDDVRLLRYPFTGAGSNGSTGFEDWAEAVATPGWHTVKMVVDPDNTVAESDEGNNIWQQQFYWSPITGWEAEYYANANVTWPPRFVRDDFQLRLDWGTGSPDPSMPSDNFSVRWKRRLTFPAGSYRFHVGHDDGVRLYIDGVQVLDQWTSCCRFDTVDQTLSEGTHEIRLEMFEGSGAAWASLWWERLDIGGWRGQYFNADDPTGDPILVRDDSPTLRFDWQSGSPDPLVQLDHFTARWTRSVVFTAAAYRFTLFHDDGVRFYIDDMLVLDNWCSSCALTETLTRSLTAGSHTLRVDYHDVDGAAGVSLAWQAETTIPPAKPGVFRGGTWFLRNSLTTGPSNIAFTFGLPTDIPLMCDWDGNGSRTIGVYRPSNAAFYLRNSNTAGPPDLALTYGVLSDVPICGDWNGDRSQTVGLFRPSAAVLFLRNTNSTGVADLAFNYGVPGDTFISGDWDGNGTDTVGIRRGSGWYIRNSNTMGPADIVFDYGVASDVPVAGDWDANGMDTPGIFRNGLWCVRNSSSTGPADFCFNYGASGDKPLVWR